MLARRNFLRLAGAGAGAILVAPRMAFASVESEQRFVFIIQRGAADGLHSVVPYADPAYATQRGELAIDAAQTLKLDANFALHPALTNLAGMYRDGQALFIHAVASPYRDRSHFDGQNVLETGGVLPYQTKDGWLNRLAGLLPAPRADAIAFAPTVPLALRGPAGVTSYAPSRLAEPTDDLLERVTQMYAQDAQLHGLWSAALTARGLAGTTSPRQDPASLGKLAATFLGRATGPRIAMIETGGWDTHSAQVPRLNAQLKALDTLVAALRDGLGPAWRNTTVLVATEFGRTVAANGTAGTDHGTGSVAMLVGGAVKGGRVIADWPGLAPRALYQGRDLQPTIGLDTVIAAAAGESFGLDSARVARALFPQARPAGGLSGLLRT